MFSRIKKMSRIVNKKFILTLLVLASPVLYIAGGCGNGNKSVTSPVTAPTLTATPTGTITHLATLTGTLTPSATPTLTVTNTATHTPTNTPTVTGTLTPLNTATSTGTNSATNTPTVTSTSTATNTPTSTIACPNPSPVVLNTAGNYALLAETGITDVSPSSVTGNVGNSPGSGTQILVTCPEVTGTIYAVDQAGPNSGCETKDPSDLGTAIGDMSTAYTTANGLPYCVLNLDSGVLSGLTLTRGVYYWSSTVSIPTNLHLNALGDSTAVWVFQIAGTLTMASGVTVFLDNGALAQNVFWTVAGANATIGTTAKFAGVLMAGPSSLIALNTGASVNGRLLSQTAITLQQNTITQP